MRLVIIYGPMGVGKLTVAKELQKLTHWPLFHNHLTFDFLEPLGHVGTKRFWSWNDALRSAWLHAGSKARFPGMIMTFCYAKGTDDATMRKFKRIIEGHGGTVHFVQLLAPEKVLHQRIMHPSRRKYKKVNTSKTLRELLKKHDLYSPIPFVESYTIDTTKVSARAAAKRIQKHYRLP